MTSHSHLFLAAILLGTAAQPLQAQRAGAPARIPTREFAVRDGRARLADHPVKLWGLRCGNALMDAATTERFVRGMDNMAAHGINLVSVYLQAGNGGYPDIQAGGNAFGPTGDLLPAYAERLEELLRAADAHGMVVLLSVLSPLKDESLLDEKAVRNAVEETARFLEQRALRNVMVDLMYEFDHPRRIHHDIYREPDGAAKKARVAAWFHAIAPEIEVGICTAAESSSPREFEGMDVRLFQKREAIPAAGFAVNIEAGRGDRYDDDGVYTNAARQRILDECALFLAAPSAAYILNSAFVQGVTGWSGSAPHAEMGGHGTGPQDRGIRFYYEWVQRHAGRWEFPQHVKDGTQVARDALPEPPVPTREFEIRGDRAYLGGHQVELWGLRCGNALMNQAVTERHVNNLDNMAAHGINTLGVYIQGSNPGWPNLQVVPSGFAADGALIPEFAHRLEWLVREADRRGMVIMVGLFSPRRDQELADEAAIQRAVEETAAFLRRRQLRNVFADIVHEFNHPRRIDHPLFREPGGPEKKARLTAWFHAIAPGIEAGICPTWNLQAELQSADTYPGMQVRIIQKNAPIPAEGFVVNVETKRLDPYDADGVFTGEQLATMRGYFEQYRAAPNATMLLHTGFCHGVTNASRTAPHPEMGGYGTGPEDRGIRFYYDWIQRNVGRWVYPSHVPVQDSRPAEPSAPTRATGELQWEPIVLWDAGEKIQGVTLGDVDPQAPGLEGIAVTQSGVVAVCGLQGSSPWSEVIHRHAMKLYAALAADIDPDLPGNELYIGGCGAGSRGVVLQAVKREGEWRVRSIWSDEGFVHSLAVLAPGAAGDEPELLVPTYTGKVLALRPDTDGTWRERLLHQEEEDENEPDRLLMKDLVSGRIGGLAGRLVFACNKAGRALLIDADSPGSCAVLHVEPGGIARTAMDLEGTLYCACNSGAVLRIQQRGGTWQVETLYRDIDQLRGIACGRFPTPRGTAPVAIYGYSGFVRALFPSGAGWDSCTLFRDTDKSHSLDAADAVPQDAGEELLLGGYSGQLILLRTRR